MQTLRKSIVSLTANVKSTINTATLLRPSIISSNIHTSSRLQYQDESEKSGRTKKWLQYNEKIFPPQEPGEEPRPAFVCHMKTNIKYSPKKMWYIACFVRGMSVDEAIKQLSFMHQKGATAVKETILEAQEMAVADHNVEFKSNLWVSESFVNKGKIIKGIRRHAKARVGVIYYRHVHYFVKLEEGKPPKHYYLPYPKSQEELLDEWQSHMRHRSVSNSL